MKTKVESMTSEKTGRSIPNQCIVYANKGTYFQSYNSVIALIPYDPTLPTQIDEKMWDYSKTTGKYRNIFLGETKKETEKKIASGEYQLADLN